MRLYSHLPSLDLHGMDQKYAEIMILEFISDQKKMKNKEFILIHGIGSGILRRKTQEVLAHHREVENFKIDNFNPGCTIVKLK